MKKYILPHLLAFFSFLFASNSYAQNEAFDMRQLACGLSQPWEIAIGPDGYIWVTEAHSYEITRVDPATGVAQTLIDLSSKKNFPDFNQATTWPQGGLQGLAFHPDFIHNPFVYVAYVYQFDGCLADTAGCFFKTKIVRYNYDIATVSLSNEMVIVDSIPGSTDHNGGRLVTGPISAGMDFLFYGVGDMGAGHLGNAARAHHGQNPDYYEGKILRFNLTPDGDVDAFDSWIPNGNPFNVTNKQSAVWSLGHRNPQGLVFSPDGILYEAEHGPYSDDEVNIIVSGHNYGFPLIMGFAEGNYDGSKAGAGSGLPAITSEVLNRAVIELSFPYSEPIGSYFAASKSDVSTYYTNDVNNTPPFNNYYLKYPTIAPSGMDIYTSSTIPGWENSLLIANLKMANIYRLKLAADGKSIIGSTQTYFQGLGRFRDIAVSKDGTKIYVATDSVGVIAGDPGQAVVPPNKGCILEFTYTTASVNESALKVDIAIFPNPASDYFTLDLPVNIKFARIVVYNLTGESVDQFIVTTDKTKFSTRNYEPGIYVVEVQSEGHVWRKKLILQ